MSVFHIKRLVRPETLRSICPRSLLALLRPHRRFFAAHGLELPPARGEAALDYSKLSHLLTSPDLHPPDELADALYYINEMATPEGMDALRDELARGAVPLFHAMEEPADVAVRAWLEDRALLERKHAELFASRPRRFEYFQSDQDPPPALPPVTAERLRPLEAYLDEAFGAKGRGRGVRVMAYPDGEDCLFMVRHADPRRREGAMKGTEETSVLYRPLRFDVVGYDARTGTLRVFAKAKWETSLYRGAFGLHLFGALDHFPRTGRYSLEPLRSGDAACLACGDAAPVKYVVLTEVRLRWGGVYDAVEEHKAKDVFAALRERTAAFPDRPRIEMASFELFVVGGRQPRRVTVLPPNVARYSHEDESRLVDQWLALRGFIRGKEAAHALEQEAQQLLPVP